MDLTEVLVIGAAGKTGRAVSRALVGRGVTVRAAVRPGSTSPVYAAGQVRAVPLDLVTGEGLGAAMTGVAGVYHLAPNVHPDEVAMAERVAEAAATEGVSRFVFHSVLHPDDTSMPHHVRKGKAERAIRARLETATILRPAAYAQNLESAARAGRMGVPYSVDTPFTNVDLEDVAEVAARILTEEGHAGEAYDLAGPERLSVRQLAQVASEVLGHPVVAVTQSREDWVAGPGAGLPAQARDDLVAMFRTYDREGSSETPRPWARCWSASPGPGGKPSVAELVSSGR
ncbi:NmrA family NAD(P)-binding protein [Knoellia sp. Soil729]|uniref:NmrA family NAD(P)-binding protein n=1 Tax=Knoellia sp. Soil729 TaxID=1736394 RepID=UPI000B10C632|nr:NmrA family NAD(P)-binding protein [Knoellia sp. Soil729]